MQYSNDKKTVIVNDYNEIFDLPIIGQGHTGVSYLTKDGQVLKYILGSKEHYNDLQMFTYIKNDNFAFPRALVYFEEPVQEKFLGYTMQYFEGVDFRHLNPNTNFNHLLTECDKIEEDINTLSSRNAIYMDDINPSNVIYTNNGELKVIDTDFYSYFPSEEEYLLYRHNMYEWGNFLLTMLAFNEFPFENSKINDLYLNSILYGKTSPTRVIRYLLEEIKDKTNHDVETLDEFHKSLSLVKKKL